MPTNKNQMTRIKVINQCLRDFDNDYGWRDLQHECIDALPLINGEERETISKKTIYNDLNYLRSSDGYNMEIETYKKGRNAYYRYTDPSMTIDKQPLSKSELELFKEALITLASISGRNEFDYFADILPRLETSLDVNLDESPIISYQSNTELKNADFVNILFKHIRNKKVLKIKYQKFNEVLIQQYTFHPYFLKQYNNRWFLFGQDPEIRELYGYHPINLPLDRIENIEISDDDFIPNTEIDFVEYFDDIVGVTKRSDAEFTKIELKIHPNTAPYIHTKPLHPYQKKLTLNKNDGFYYTTLELYPNNELYSVLLSYGTGVEVISPTFIRDYINNKVIEMKEMYS